MIIHPNNKYKQRVDPPVIPSVHSPVIPPVHYGTSMSRLALWSDEPLEPYNIPVVEDPDVPPDEIRFAPTNYTYRPRLGEFRCGCSECTTIRRQRELEHNEY